MDRVLKAPMFHVTPIVSRDFVEVNKSALARRDDPRPRHGSVPALWLAGHASENVTTKRDGRIATAALVSVIAYATWWVGS